MKKRMSNIELLRITAMLMIIAYHIFRHCITLQLTDPNSIQKFGNGWYCQPRFSEKLCILAVISPMGQIGNAIFILVSGYFMAHKEAIDLSKIAKKLLLQLGFAAILLGLISIYAYQNITEFPIKLIRFSAFNELCWYLGYYFTVIVVAKIFLNRYLNQFTQKNYAMFLMVVFALTQFSWSVGVLSNLGKGLEVMCTGIFLYSLGGYVKKYNPFACIRLWAVIAIMVISELVVIGNFYINTAEKILEFDPNGENMFVQIIPTYENHHIVPILLGIAIFELFRRIKIPNNAVINFMGASTFMAYLLHDNQFFYNIWNTQDWITLLHQDMIQFSVTYFVWILKIFIVGLLGYCLFEITAKLLKICKPLVLKRSIQQSKETTV